MGKHENTEYVLSEPFQKALEGYVEYQFQEAFELLCEKFGGRERGREEAKRLIEEMDDA